jgi:hypothetical protein
MPMPPADAPTPDPAPPATTRLGAIDLLLANSVSAGLPQRARAAYGPIEVGTWTPPLPCQILAVQFRAAPFGPAVAVAPELPAGRWAALVQWRPRGQAIREASVEVDPVTLDPADWRPIPLPSPGWPVRPGDTIAFGLAPIGSPSALDGASFAMWWAPA